MRSNVYLRRKGFEFPGARTIWICHLRENFWNELEGLCKTNYATVYIGHVKCLSKQSKLKTIFFSHWGLWIVDLKEKTIKSSK